MTDYLALVLAPWEEWEEGAVSPLLPLGPGPRRLPPQPVVAGTGAARGPNADGGEPQTRGLLAVGDTSAHEGIAKEEPMGVAQGQAAMVTKLHQSEEILRHRAAPGVEQARRRTLLGEAMENYLAPLWGGDISVAGLSGRYWPSLEGRALPLPTEHGGAAGLYAALRRGAQRAERVGGLPSARQTASEQASGPAAAGPAELDLIFQRDARRYGGAFGLY